MFGQQPDIISALERQTSPLVAEEPDRGGRFGEELGGLKSDDRCGRIRVRSEKGNVVLVVVDAESGAILSTKGQR